MKNRRFICLAAILSASVALFGCSADRVSGPLGPAAAKALGGSSNVRQVVGPLGGTLSIDGVMIQVPAGALQESVELTMSKVDGGSVVELGPHGLQFARPVYLSFVVPAGVDPGRAVVQWYNPATQTWVSIPSTAAGFTRKAPLQHFSKYMLTIPEELN